MDKPQGAHLFDRDPDDVRRHNFNDVELQEPPDEELELMDILQELQKEHGQAVHNQMPLIPQIWGTQNEAVWGSGTVKN